MAKQKKDSEYTDAKGNLHKQFADGRAEIYVGGYDANAEYLDITDVSDVAVNRKRFLKHIPVRVENTLTTRDDAEVAVPGIDSDDPEIGLEGNGD